MNTTQRRNYLIDMDGVLVHGTRPIPGAPEFIARLNEGGYEYLVLTNNPIYTPGDLAHRLARIGIPVPAARIYTSAMATAQFLETQKPGGTVYAVGESGLTSELHRVGYVITDSDPDYVVLGETLALDLEAITKAIRLIIGGAHFIATNPDPTGPSERGLIPACGATAALIQVASGRQPLFIGKPNPLMMRKALNHLGVHSDQTVMIGDRMDTDIIAGLQTGMDTILVMTGVTGTEDIHRFPYRPTWVLDSVAKIELW